MWRHVGVLVKNSCESKLKAAMDQWVKIRRPPTPYDLPQ